MRPLLLITAVALSGGLVLSPAYADPVADKVKEAKLLLKQKEHEKAVSVLADAIVLAQKSDALVAEQDAARELADAIDALPSESPRAGESTDRVPFGKRRALATAMARLDPKRRSAFVSAPAIAHSLLLLATEHGDGLFVAEAATVLEPHAKTPKAGRAAAALAKYATALRHAAGGQPGAGAPLLEEALAAAEKEDWKELAMYVGFELTATWLRLEAPDKAKAALARIAVALGPEPGDDFARQGIRMVATRFQGAPADVMEALPRSFRRGVSGGRGADGRAGDSGRGDEPSVSKVGKAMPKHPRAKPLVTVTRTPKGWEIRQGFDPKFVATFPYADSLAHFEDGGVTLSFHREMVGLDMIDPEGLRGAPGVGPTRSLARAFHPVGRGERYGVTKDGLVTIE